MNAGLTLIQRYYKINEALNNYLKVRGTALNFTCPVIKYGIDRATLKSETKSQADKYPYIQTYVMNVSPVAWTSYESGILTDFEYQLSFFTSPRNEFMNDTDYFIPFDVAKNALSDINLQLLKTTDQLGNVTTLADLQDVKFHYEFEMKSGSPVPSAFLIAKMRAVCGYVIDPGYAPATMSTNLDNAIKYIWSN